MISRNTDSPPDPESKMPIIVLYINLNQRYNKEMKNEYLCKVVPGMRVRYS